MAGIAISRLVELVVEAILDRFAFAFVELRRDRAGAIEIGRVPEGLAEPLNEVRVAVDVPCDRFGNAAFIGDVVGGAHQGLGSRAEDLGGLSLERQVADVLGAE